MREAGSGQVKGREKSAEVQVREQKLGRWGELGTGKRLESKGGEGSLGKESSLLTSHSLWAKNLLLKEFLILSFIGRPLNTNENHRPTGPDKS